MRFLFLFGPSLFYFSEVVFAANRASKLYTFHFCPEIFTSVFTEIYVYLLKYVHADLMVGCLPAWQSGGGSCPPGFHCVFGYCKPGIKPDGNVGYDYQVIFNHLPICSVKTSFEGCVSSNSQFIMFHSCSCYFECTMKPDLNYFLNLNINISVMLEILNKKYEL